MHCRQQSLDKQNTEIICVYDMIVCMFLSIYGWFFIVFNFTFDCNKCFIVRWFSNYFCSLIIATLAMNDDIHRRWWWWWWMLCTLSVVCPNVFVSGREINCAAHSTHTQTSNHPNISCWFAEFQQQTINRSIHKMCVFLFSALCLHAFVVSVHFYKQCLSSCKSHWYRANFNNKQMSVLLLLSTSD